MPLSTHAELLTSLALWLDRSDLTAMLPEFIALNEARLNRLLRVPAMEASATSSVSSGTVALPDDCLQLRKVVIDDEAIPAFSPQQLHAAYGDSTYGSVLGYAVSGQEITLLPAPSASIDVVVDYYQKIPALTSTNTTNWLLESHPDLYLYGTLCMAEAFVDNPDRVAVWKSAWDAALDELIAHGNKQRLPAGPLVMRPAVTE